MIEAEQSIVIDTNINNVWNYVRDISRWAILFPGCRECNVINEQDSNWTIKVGAGGLVKTVNVRVHVDQWDGPGCVNFSYQLDKEPVVGSGSYTAAPKGENATEITLKVRVEGSGPMAPMWEAVSKPLLPQLAKLFAGKLKTEIESIAGTTSTTVTAVPTLPFAAIGRWLKRLLRTLFGSKAQSEN